MVRFSNPKIIQGKYWLGWQEIDKLRCELSAMCKKLKKLTLKQYVKALLLFVHNNNITPSDYEYNCVTT